VKTKRKLQVSNGHYLDFDQTARLIHTVANADQDQKMTMAIFEEETGLPFRQVRNRVSVARAMGLFTDKGLQLTPFGKLIALHDPFFENRGSLEYVHYLAAGNYKNIIWYEVFNTLLASGQSTDYQGWLSYFRNLLFGEYSKKSLKDHLPKEVRFIIEAYTENNLKDLELLCKDAQDKLYKRRYLNPSPLIFSAMLYHYAEQQKADLMQVEDLLQTPGSPAMLFFMGREMFNNTVELLHDKGYLRYEGTHDLNQLRLKENHTANDFLTAYYEKREPESR
jgi:hypothetical protein